MQLLGLTGGVGMGKTTSAGFLQQRGIPLVDTDVLAREVVEPGRPALKEIEEFFGSEIIAPDGTLSRETLAQRVFADPAARKTLEEILHPRIRELWQAQAEAWRSRKISAGVVVIPLLFETEAESFFDAILCSACSGTTQRQRLAARNWTREQIEQRIAAQWSIDQKMLRSDYVIWTEGPLEVHAAQINGILRFLD